MRVILGIENYTENVPLYLALGNFDGVHRGHKQLIKAAVDKAHREGGQAGAFIFDPHPAQVLFPDKAPRLLVSPASKTRLLEACGLDTLIYSAFTHEIASWSPEEFVNSILINRLHVKEVFVGFNYSFGYRGMGTPETLKQIGSQSGFSTNVIDPVMIDNELVSSSLVRSLLEQGNVKKAATMLGYSPFLTGKVIHGEHRGSTIGFPTANVGINASYTVPGKGVYAALARVGEESFRGVVNIGSKPTFHDAYPISIEAHIADFNRDIYDQSITLTFMDKLRDEKRFASIEALLDQITQDKETAIHMLDSNRFKDSDN